MGQTTETTGPESMFIEFRRKVRAMRMMRIGVRWVNVLEELFRIEIFRKKRR